MKKNSNQIFQEIDFLPFRVFEENGLRCEFYNLTTYSKYEVYMEDLYTKFENNNKSLKILIHPDYYEASKALFDDRLIPYLFEYWPLFGVYSKRSKFYRFFTVAPFAAVVLFFIRQNIFYSILALVLVATSFILYSNIRQTAKRINFLREKMIKIMTVEKNEQLKKNLDKYYTQKNEKLKNLQNEKEREAEITRNIKEHLEQEASGFVEAQQELVVDEANPDIDNI